ncbi:MAG: MFS transporter [Pseudomonadota bacterium]
MAPTDQVTSSTGTALSDRPWQNVAVLMAANGILGSQLSALFIVGGLAGAMLAPHPCLATLPISLIVLGSMLSATPLSSLMQRRGRRAGFFVGAGAGAVGGALGSYGLYAGEFIFLLLGSLLSGTYMSAQAFYRFAAIDVIAPERRGKAISMVLAAGLLAAVVGPQIVKWTAESWVIPYFGTYLAVAGLNVVGAVIFLFLAPTAVAEEGSSGGRSRMALLTSHGIAVAVICATVSYALMNLVMTATPLAVVGCGFAINDAANVVSVHVLAMFAPAFFTGSLIRRFGAVRIVATGLLILAGAGVTALSGVALGNFFGALFLLGLGWNFGFIGATTMLADYHSPEERGRIQGLNDTIVFGAVTMASLASGGLMNCAGTDPVAGWSAVNLAMLPLLSLAAVALVWFARQERRARPS